MAQYTSREKIDAVFQGKNLGLIPKMFNGPAYMMAHNTIAPGPEGPSPMWFAQVSKAFADDYGLDINMIGGYGDYTAVMGAGLVNQSGEVSQTGEEVVSGPDDLEKLNPFDIEKCMGLKDAVANLKALQKIDPDRPNYAIIINPPMAASSLTGATVYYRNMRKNPQFIKDITAMMVEPLKQGLKVLADAGLDVAWIPVPTMGGTCVTKKNYVDMCYPHSKEIVQYCHEIGLKVCIHTCGDWNDRFDVVYDEGPECLHLSLAKPAEFYRDWSDKMASIGNISVVDVLLYGTEQETYDVSYQTCIDLAGRGNYIMGPDCDTPANVPEANVRAMYRAADDAQKALFG